MESMANCNTTSLSPKPSPSTLHHLLSHLPSSLRLHQSHHHAFKAKASSTIPLNPQKHFTKKRTKPTIPPRKFREQDAFPDSIPIHTKNPHSVYKDIQSFARQNKLKQVLEILDYLDHRGIPVNVTTFSSIIEACVRMRALREARAVHTHIRINGLESNEFLQTKLVNMYAACGAVEDAKKVFDGIPVRSVYPWNALLRGNVVLGGRKYHEVLDTFYEMRAQGVELNVYSFSCLIKSVAGASAFSHGLRTHGILVKNGFLESNIIRTSLIDMYFKCGKINLACRVFEEIENRDVVAWGAMIAGFAHNRLQREALECTRQMIDAGMEVNSVILTTILPVIGEMWAWRIGQEAHAYVLKTKDYSKQLFIQSALIDMYCKSGDLASGRKVFYSSKERNTVSWTALLAGYVESGRLDQALRSITWMQQEGFKPDIVTLATVLPVCGKLKTLLQGKEIHGYAVKNGFLPNVSIATSLMMMYAKCGLVEYSVRVFGGMEKRNVIAWTAMISSYIESGCLDKALEVFRAMQLSKHRPDSVAMARMLEICSELRDLKLGREVHAQVLKKNLECVPFVSAETIRMYGSCGAIDEARFSFDMVSVKGPITWTAIIEAYGFTGEYVEALETFKQMTLKGSHPNAFTFKAILHICEQAGFADDACRFFSLMTKRYKIEASKEHYDIIISLLNSVGQFEKADRFVHLRSLLE